MLMATEAQIAANRLNAQKSTGPRTDEGKARVAQNAVKHGLLAQEAVIRGEDPADFEAHRQAILAELAPVGAIESMLAERVVGLLWRLRRAERLQNEAFKSLYLTEASCEFGELMRKRMAREPGGPQGERGRDDLIVGRVAMKDFGHVHTLERLGLYERRLEQSLCRTMAELRRLREPRSSDVGKEEPKPEPASVEEDSRDIEKSAPQVEPVRWEAGEEPADGQTFCEEESHAETWRCGTEAKMPVGCSNG
jgi:hypothetical protein